MSETSTNPDSDHVAHPHRDERPASDLWVARVFDDQESSSIRSAADAERTASKVVDEGHRTGF